MIGPSLGPVTIGLTPDGRYAIKWQRGDSEDGWSAALSVMPGESPRWGVLWEWRF